MSSYIKWAAARQILIRPRLQLQKLPTTFTRRIHVDGRARRSNEWAPSGGIAVGGNEDAHSKLIRAGFIRQSHSGIFQLLPLGLRVQDKITQLVDRYMRGLGASRVQLSAISSESLWEQSGRLDKIGSELFRFTDRKEGRFLLGPTHEEEITSIVARSVQSYKSLPLRLYQITQKYRDELRPRHGLLRGRDFCMKDLYTFDYSVETALQTYEDVRKAYSQIFIQEMKLPILVAKASSGDMGGDLSHEYHIPTSLGEDLVMSCNKCDYVANEEVVQARVERALNTSDLDNISAWRGISKDRKTIVNVFYDTTTGATHKDINTHAVKQIITDLDAGVEDTESLWSEALRSHSGSVKLVNLFDCRMSEQVMHDFLRSDPQIFPSDSFKYRHGALCAEKNHAPGSVNFLRVQDGDGCPHCSDGTLSVFKAIELGHTFHLGTRYSEPMKASVTGPKRLLLEPPTASQSRFSSEETTAEEAYPPTENTVAPMQMGCHGIGISRIIGAVAHHLVDSRGLNWPRIIAPYEVVIVINNAKDEQAMSTGEAVYDALTESSDARVNESSGQLSPIDAIIDDRHEFQMGWKLKDADLVGYPVIVVVGKEWKASRRVEVQCRRLGFTELKTIPELRHCVEGLLQQL
ncbi:hypothetical protein N0V93_003516 [Gnomoniopsis smithogilvyi]|uniref:proline--tRNA ligase n=1 Tax=Gnomoniopsis smithogilvyi TaxID=1191159 RepID=A0A9W8YYI2_9PEZI|nr:hypothetical protein N0V93_003516 [Gnomoniopsis smithogilvyi]